MTAPAPALTEYRRLLTVLALPLLATLARYADAGGRERQALVRGVLTTERDRATTVALANEAAVTESEGER